MNVAVEPRQAAGAASRDGVLSDASPSTRSASIDKSASAESSPPGNLHKRQVACAMSDKLIPLIRDAYPDIAVMTPEEVKPERHYATYRMGLFLDDKACVQPTIVKSRSLG